MTTQNTLDKYSIMIAAQFLKTKNDFIQLIQVSKKLYNVLDLFHHNPISITSLKMFPNMETHHIYSKKDIRIGGMYKYVIWNELRYYDMLWENATNVIYKSVVFNEADRKRWERNYPESCDDNNRLITIELPKEVTSIESFRFCSALTKVVLPTSIKIIKDDAFCRCTSLQSITLPLSVKSVGSRCFSGCYSLKTLTIQSPQTTFGN
ncbi:Leucine rich repeat protein [Entamoeba marina]